MKRPAVVSSVLFSLFLAWVSACDSDDPCADGSCEVDERDETSEPTDPPPTPIPCLPACDALLDNCGETPTGDSSLVRAISECIDWCEAGGLSPDEVACLESIDCAAADECLQS